MIDADGLYITTKDLDLIRGYDLALLTPNKNEFARLAKQLGVPLEGEGAPADPLMEIAKALDGPVIVRKGAKDAICDGKRSLFNGEAGSKRRAGGQVRIGYNLDDHAQSFMEGHAVHLLSTAQLCLNVSLVPQGYIFKA